MPDFHDSVPILVVTGPTATGKTRLAVALARRLNGEVVSADSRQVYRFMDIGTGKDLAEYGDVPYHLIDIADPAGEIYNLGRFCHDAWRAIGDIADRGKVPVVCGGTALYIAALLDRYRLPGGALPPREFGSPRVRQDRDAPDSFHPPFRLRPLVMGVLYPRQEVRRRIEQRLDARLEAGMIDEVRRLHEAHRVPLETLEAFGLEYREVARFLRGECDFAAMRETLLNRIRQFAKRQDIFFRKLEREGHKIHWLERGVRPDPFSLAKRFLRGEEPPEVSFRLCDHPNPPSR